MSFRENEFFEPLNTSMLRIVGNMIVIRDIMYAISGFWFLLNISIALHFQLNFAEYSRELCFRAQRLRILMYSLNDK